MRRVHDQLEERRVMRLLEGAAADVPELSRTEIALLTAARAVRRRNTRRVAVATVRVRLLAPAVAAAAIAALVLAGGSIPGHAPRDERSPTVPTRVVVFPEASALELLLGHRRGGAT